MDLNTKKKLDNFLNNKNLKNKIIVVYGPTASGKTSLGIDIAKYINSEIISTDSRQIFKYLNIGTGKATKEEMNGITHHMIDIITPNISYSVGEFVKESLKIIDNLFLQNKVPILVGGTGLYIDSLIYDFDIPKIPGDIILRKKLEKEASKFGKDFVYEKLIEIDPEYAKTIHPNNLNYVIRGIEVKMLSGKSKLDFVKEKKLKYDTLFLTPYNGDREKLYEKINKRISLMFDFGLVEEVVDLLNNGFLKTDFGLNTIGYKEVIEFLDGKITKQECIDKVSQANRNYAKRQLTWFRKYPN